MHVRFFVWKEESPGREKSSGLEKKQILPSSHLEWLNPFSLAKWGGLHATLSVDKIAAKWFSAKSGSISNKDCKQIDNNWSALHFTGEIWWIQSLLGGVQRAFLSPLHSDGCASVTHTLVTSWQFIWKSAHFLNEFCFTFEKSFRSSRLNFQVESTVWVCNSEIYSFKQRGGSPPQMKRLCFVGSWLG